jgi:N-acylethanolamine-hydrolysing acid amidase
MMIFNLLLVAVLPLASRASSRPPTFTFDYDKPPASRWDGALALATQGKSWEDTWGSIFSYHNSSVFDYLTPSMYTLMGDALQQHFPEQAEELQGISKQFSELFPVQVVSFEYLASWVYYHELAHSDFGSSSAASDNSKSCTGLLAADSSGMVHHVANMDQSPPTIRDVTLHVQFVDGEDNLYEGVDWYWFTTGTSRMVMPGVVSIQENWRMGETLALADLLEDFDDGVPPHIFVFRRALEGVVQDPTIDFEDLVEQMSTMRLASPYYVVMAGPKKMQGAVIARNNAGVASPDGEILRLGEDDGNPYYCYFR